MFFFISLFVFSFNFKLCADVPLKEKISQLIIASVDINENEKVEKLLKEKIGGLQLQWGSFSLEETRKFTSKIYEKSDIPPFIAIDYEGGSVFHPATLGLIDLPTNMMLGAANDPDNTASLFYLAGLELRKAGINMVLAPVVDVNTNPENPIIGVRAFSSDPQIVAKLGNSVLNGFKAAGIISTLKHFPGHGDTYTDSHKTLPIINTSKKDLEKHLFPFKKIIDENKVELIMTAHILYTQIDHKYPASLSEEIMQNLLRKELNYNGAIITDSLDMKAITKKYNIPQASVLALKNGADILLIGKGDFFKVRNELEKEIINGNIPISRLNQAYERVMKLKSSYELKNLLTENFDKAYNQITKELSEKAITIFKDKNLIPLKKENKISAIFFMPQRFSNQSLSFYKTLKNAGYEITHYNFPINPDEKDIKKIQEMVENSQTIIIGSFQWTALANKNQKKAIENLLILPKEKIIISLMNPYDIRNYYEKADSVILTYGITDFTMESLSKILSGEKKAKGLLPVNIDF